MEDKLPKKWIEDERLLEQEADEIFQYVATNVKLEILLRRTRSLLSIRRLDMKDEVTLLELADTLGELKKLADKFRDKERFLVDSEFIRKWVEALILAVEKQGVGISIKAVLQDITAEVDKISDRHGAIAKVYEKQIRKELEEKYIGKGKGRGTPK